MSKNKPFLKARWSFESNAWFTREASAPCKPSKRTHRVDDPELESKLKRKRRHHNDTLLRQRHTSNQSGALVRGMGSKWPPRFLTDQCPHTVKASYNPKLKRGIPCRKKRRLRSVHPAPNSDMRITSRCPTPEKETKAIGRMPWA